MTYLYTALAVLILDLVTKELAQEFFAQKPYDLLPFVKLFLIHNKGAAFGMFAQSPDIIRVPLLLITPVLALIVTYIYASKNKETKTQVLMGMIAGGALGNLYDRLLLKEVRDFIHLHIGDFYWPAFNLADASITTAIMLLLMRYFRK